MTKAKGKDLQNKGIEIEIGGKVRHLLFDMNAYCEYEDIYGTTETIMETASSKKIKDVRSMVRIGLLHEYAKATDNMIGSWMSNMEQYTEAQEKVFYAVVASLPKETQEAIQQALENTEDAEDINEQEIEEEEKN